MLSVCSAGKHTDSQFHTPSTLSFRNHGSGQLHAIAAKLDAGECHTHQATGGPGNPSREADLDQCHSSPGESQNRLAIGRSGSSRTSSSAREAMIGKGPGAGGSFVDYSFKSKADGQMAFQETKRRLAKQAR
jgi:hypothetical protein